MKIFLLYPELCHLHAGDLISLPMTRADITVGSGGSKVVLASEMEGCKRVTITSGLNSLFPVLPQLSSKGEGVRRPFPRAGPGAVSCPKLQVLGFGGLDRAGGCCEGPA